MFFYSHVFPGVPRPLDGSDKLTPPLTGSNPPNIILYIKIRTTKKIFCSPIRFKSVISITVINQNIQSPFTFKQFEHISTLVQHCDTE